MLKKELLCNKKMNEEELNNYINKMKMKIQKKNLEENESSEVLSTNLGDLENIKNNVIENNENEINFIGKKREAAESEEVNNVLSSLENVNSSIVSQNYEKELTDIINNDKVNDCNLFKENLELKTDFVNFNYVESVYNNNNDKMNKYSITQDNSQIINVFNNNNNLLDGLDCYNQPSENKEDFALFFLIQYHSI